MQDTLARRNNRGAVVTCALPYANNHLHLGHILEFVQADIWVRSQRLQGKKLWFVCAEDAHGAPIMLQAEKEKLSIPELLEKYYRSHHEDLKAFGIGLDYFGSSHTPENQKQVEYIYQALKQSGHIEKKMIEQLYDEEKACFLPDRFVRVTCPRCEAIDQYGDNCERCGATYQPEQLMESARSALSGCRPILKKSEHIFFRLDHFQSALQTWIAQTPLQASVRNKLKEWFDTPLKPWDISRDAPYFGFEIPGEVNKFFYVWLDAPIAYLSTFGMLCSQIGLDFEDFWNQTGQFELYHFIGKDIIYFHSLFWPALLMGVQRPLPTNLFVHGYLTINGEKMSKSRGTFIEARAFRTHVPPEVLRYYYAVKLNAQVEDIDLNLEDCIQRFNTDIVNHLVNLASRSARLLEQHHCGKLGILSSDASGFQSWCAVVREVFAYYDQRQFSKAIAHIMQMVQQANQRFQQAAPWKLVREEVTEGLDANLEHLRNLCTEALNCFQISVVALSPVLPDFAQRVFAWLNEPLDGLASLRPLPPKTLAPFSKLAERIDPKVLKQSWERV